MASSKKQKSNKNLNPLDLLDIRSELSEEECITQDTVTRFVNKQVLPIIKEAFEEHFFPTDLIPEIANLGLLGSSIKGYDCAGLNSICYGLICQELERGDSGLRSFVSVQSSLVMYPIFSYGSEEQKKKWLPSLAKGESIGCFGLTEPHGGSDPTNMKTHAKKDGNDWILNGSTMWITNGSISDIAIVWAKTEDGVVRGFIVEKGMNGFSAPVMKNKWSLRASVTSELILDNVFVPEENILPNVKGMKGPLGCLTQARYGIGWGAIGAAMAVYEASLKYAKERIQFDKPIASFQLVQEKLVWMLNEITKGQLIALQTGQNKDNDTLKFQQVSLIKRNNVWVARECCKLAREIHGANGISGEYPIMRHLMNIESVYTYEGTHDMHTLILGNDITDIPSFE